MSTLAWVLALSLPITPNLWCIWHAFRHDFPGPNEQLLWVRVGTFVPVLGGLLYLFFGFRRAKPLHDPQKSLASQNGGLPPENNHTGVSS